jgi:3-oxoacyl-[acyl-carrier-protein] synthase I
MVFVSCVSLVCPAGYSAVSTAAALRAGIPAFAETGYRDVNGEPIVCAAVEALRPDLRGRARLVELINLALGELEPRVVDALPWKRMPLILCSRETERPGARLAGIVPKLRFPGGVTFAGKRAVHVAGGATSAFQAIGAARSLLDQPDVTACLMLAVDSLIDARVLQWLDRTQRLKTSDRTDGVIPGEAACLAVVSTKPFSDDAVPVHGLGAAVEPATVLNEEPFRAEGMTAALNSALREAGVEMHDVDFRLSDVAGESYAFEELVLAQTRVMRKVRPSQPLWHPADCIGDCGAAAGLVQLAWVAHAFQRGYAPGPVAALHTSSAFGPRAAAVVAAGGWGRA